MRVILSGNFPGGNFLEGSYSGWEFAWVGFFPVGIVRGESSGWEFLRVGVFLVPRNEVMQPTTSFKHRSQLFLNHVHNQAGFAKSVINGRDHIYLGISKLVFTLGKLERLIFDHMRIILGSWKSRY